MASQNSQLAFVLHGVDDVRIEERPRIDRSKIAPLEVIVSPKRTGICGSDVHYVKHMAIGDFKVEKPMVLGHESAGVVLHVGSEVTALQPGDQVALEPGASCRVCAPCKDGAYEHCPEMKFAATPPYDGSLCAEYQLPADLCYKLPAGVSLEEGAMIEPLSVGVHALTKVGRLKPNQNVCVFGAGPVGLLTMAAAKALGARRIVAVDIAPDRLDFAKRYAATDVFLPSAPRPGEPRMEFSKREAKRLTDELGLHDRSVDAVDLVVDASGAEACIQMGLFVCRTRGTFVQVGMGAPNVQVPVTDILVKALTIKGSFRYGAGVYPLAIDLVAQGKISLGPLISHRFRFEDAKKAFDCTAAGKGDDGKGVIKVIIEGPE